MIHKTLARMMAPVLAIAVLASAANAQFKRPTIAQAAAFLLGNKEVQTDLGLNKQQISTITAAFNKYADEASVVTTKFRKDKKNYDKYNKELHGYQQVFIDRSLGVLTALQKSRLRQIGVQHYGPFTLKIPDVAKELKLTAAQSSMIKNEIAAFEKLREQVEASQRAAVKAIPQPKQTDKKAVDAYKAKVQALMKSRSSKDRDKILAAKTKAENKILASLSKSQKAAYEKLKGRPVPKASKL